MDNNQLPDSFGGDFDNIEEQLAEESLLAQVAQYRGEREISAPEPTPLLETTLPTEETEKKLLTLDEIPLVPSAYATAELNSQAKVPAGASLFAKVGLVLLAVALVATLWLGNFALAVVGTMGALALAIFSSATWLRVIAGVLILAYTTSMFFLAP